MGIFDAFKKHKKIQVPEQVPEAPKASEITQSYKKRTFIVICPYCNALLDPELKRKKRCPFCDKPIFLRTRPSDWQRVLVTKAGAKEIDDEWQKLRTQKAEAMKEKRTLDNQDALKRYIDSGLTKVAVFPVSDERCCAVCKAAAGIYPIQKAPKLPISGCTSKKGCRCAYLPVIA